LDGKSQYLRQTEKPKGDQWWLVSTDDSHVNNQDTCTTNNCAAINNKNKVINGAEREEVEGRAEMTTQQQHMQGSPRHNSS
jgi:hypothetical protein